MKRILTRLRPDQEPVYISLDAWRKWYYDFYLESEHWKQTREKTLEFFGYICPLCGRKAFQVHHYARGYGFLWCEKPGVHTVAICGKCHQKIHG